MHETGCSLLGWMSDCLTGAAAALVVRPAAARITAASHRPSYAALGVTAPHGAAPPVGDSAPHRDTFKAPLPGEIESIVQALPADKKAMPDDCTKWRYEVVLAVPDPGAMRASEQADRHSSSDLPLHRAVDGGPWLSLSVCVCVCLSLSLRLSLKASGSHSDLAITREKWGGVGCALPRGRAFPFQTTTCG
jgi:hypothetical protein